MTRAGPAHWIGLTGSAHPLPLPPSKRPPPRLLAPGAPDWPARPLCRRTGARSCNPPGRRGHRGPPMRWVVILRCHAAALSLSSPPGRRGSRGSSRAPALVVRLAPRSEAVVSMHASVPPARLDTRGRDRQADSPSPQPPAPSLADSPATVVFGPGTCQMLRGPKIGPPCAPPRGAVCLVSLRCGWGLIMRALDGGGAWWTPKNRPHCRQRLLAL